MTRFGRFVSFTAFGAAVSTTRNTAVRLGRAASCSTTLADVEVDDDAEMIARQHAVDRLVTRSGVG